MTAVVARPILVITGGLLLAVGLVMCGRVQAITQGCQLTLSESRVDLGLISRAQILDSEKDLRGQALWGTRSMTLSAVCENKSSVLVMFNGEAAQDDHFRFGRFGTLKLRVVSAWLDGHPVKLRADSRVEVPTGNQWFRYGERLRAYDGATPAEGRNLNLQFEVQAWIDPADTMARSKQCWEGDGYFEVLQNL